MNAPAAIRKVPSVGPPQVPRRPRGFGWAVGIACAAMAAAGPYTGTQQSSRLYTPPDPAAPGGLRGALELPAGRTVQEVLAVSRSDPIRVYRATVDRSTASFVLEGLPVGYYDLVVWCSDAFYEGLVLWREPSTLTEQEREAVTAHLKDCVPFFDTKRVHRCEGRGGPAGQARCVLQEVRTRPVTLQDASVRSDIQIRSLKLAWLEEVGGGRWQLGGTRELVRQEVGPGDARGVLPHYFSERLRGFRVVDAVREVGVMSLK